MIKPIDTNGIYVIRESLFQSLKKELDEITNEFQSKIDFEDDYEQEKLKREKNNSLYKAKKSFIEKYKHLFFWITEDGIKWDRHGMRVVFPISKKKEIELDID